MKRKISLALILASALMGCHSGTLAERSFSDTCWSMMDTIHFKAPTNRFEVELTFSAQDFPYRNIYLRLGSGKGLEQSDTLFGDTLLDPLGNWLVEPDGLSVTKRFQVQAPFSPNDQYWLIHYLRDSSLCGIHDVWIGQSTTGK